MITEKNKSKRKLKLPVTNFMLVRHMLKKAKTMKQ
jgi:hypothetical protein